MRAKPAKGSSTVVVKVMSESRCFRGCLHDPALPGCNEHWHHVHKIVGFDEIAQGDELSFYVRLL